MRRALRCPQRDRHEISAVADINGDSATDFIVNHAVWFPGISAAGSFTFGGVRPITDPPALGRNRGVADMNSDGMNDLVYAGVHTDGNGGVYTREMWRGAQTTGPDISGRLTT